MTVQDAINAVLYKHKDKNFVQRILKPDPKNVLDNGDGSFSTHSMAYGEADGKYFVYPTVVQTEQGLQRLDDRQAWEYSVKTGEAIPFDTAEEAEWFSQNYKKVWNNE